MNLLFREYYYLVLLTENRQLIIKLSHEEFERYFPSYIEFCIRFLDVIKKNSSSTLVQSFLYPESIITNILLGAIITQRDDTLTW